MDGIVVKSLYKRYLGEKGRAFAALFDIDFTLHPGEFVSLVGESGSGKSTLARLLIGLEQPDEGDILLDGESIRGWTTSRWRPHRKKIQAVFQDAGGTLNPMLSVYRNLEQALLNLSDLSAPERRSRLEELMELAGLGSELLGVPPRKLSGGEQRRLSLVQAMSVQPRYLVLDEVLSGLDLISADKVLRLMKKFHKEYDCAFLLITHDLDSACRLSDRILQMQHGRFVREGI